MRIVHQCADIVDFDARIACDDQNTRRLSYVFAGSIVTVVVAALLFVYRQSIPVWAFWTLIVGINAYSVMTFVAAWQGWVR